MHHNDAINPVSVEPEILEHHRTHFFVTFQMIISNSIMKPLMNMFCKENRLLRLTRQIKFLVDVWNRPIKTRKNIIAKVS